MNKCPFDLGREPFLFGIQNHEGPSAFMPAAGFAAPIFLSLMDFIGNLFI